MAKNGWAALALALGLLVPGVSYSNGSVGSSSAAIAMIGLDDSNNPVALTLSPQEYQGRLSAALIALRDAVVPSLTSGVSNAASAWKLRTVVAGVGVAAQVGIGPIVTIKAAPRFRIVFGDSTDPAVP